MLHLVFQLLREFGVLSIKSKQVTPLGRKVLWGLMGGACTETLVAGMKQACSTTVLVCRRESEDGLDTKACGPYVPKKIRFDRSEAGAAALAPPDFQADAWQQHHDVKHSTWPRSVLFPG